MTGSAPLIAVAFAAAVTLGSGLTRVQEAAPPPAVPAHVETGPELFVSSGCAHCHIIDGKGGVKGPNLSGIGRRWKDDAIRVQIENGALEMPPYKDVLTEPQIATLVKYLHTRRAREPKVKQPVPAAAEATKAPVSDPS